MFSGIVTDVGRMRRLRRGADAAGGLEAAIATTYDMEFVGIVNDDSTDVGRVHLFAIAPFTFYKFRGMFVDSYERWPELFEYSYTPDEVQDLRFHPEHDPRVTRVGRLIRRTSPSTNPTYPQNNPDSMADTVDRPITSHGLRTSTRGRKK